MRTTFKEIKNNIFWELCVKFCAKLFPCIPSRWLHNEPMACVVFCLFLKLGKYTNQFKLLVQDIRVSEWSSQIFLTPNSNCCHTSLFQNIHVCLWSHLPWKVSWWRSVHFLCYAWQRFTLSFKRFTLSFLKRGAWGRKANPLAEDVYPEATGRVSSILKILVPTS